MPADADHLPPMAKTDMKHGTECHCPTCGSWGRFDVMPEGIADFDDAVFFNQKEGQWECFDCWLK